jgi:transcriptional regulator with XRE-family HTH domain
MTAIINIVAYNMRLFRDKKHLSQKEVALSVGIPQGQYSRIENGKVEPSLSTLEKLTNFFDISMADLFQTSKQVINTHPDPVNLPLLEKVKLLDLLDKDEQTALLKLIDMAITKKMLKDSLTNLVASADSPLDLPTFNAIKLKTKGFQFNREEANAR